MKDTSENENPTVLDLELKDEPSLQDEKAVHPGSSDESDTYPENASEDMILQSLAAIISNIYFKKLCLKKKTIKQ